MRDRDGYPAGVPCWIDTAQPDPAAATAFYGELFGWEFEDRMPSDADGHYFVARLDGHDVAAIGSPPGTGQSRPEWTTYIAVDRVDEVAARLTAAGGKVLAEPFDILDAGRMAVCCDPSGAGFSLWEAKAHKGAGLVNVPGTWNFSDLHTDDLDGARAFYSTVFGWEFDTFDFGGSVTLVRLPGYGDFLEAREPELRARQAEAGVPAGFEDAIAWMVPLTDERAGESEAPRWAVTFAVEDTDAIVARAAEVGGRILVPPYDMPPVRAAVIADPQGASFTVSKYDPTSGA